MRDVATRAHGAHHRSHRHNYAPPLAHHRAARGNCPYSPPTGPFPLWMAPTLSEHGYTRYKQTRRHCTDTLGRHRASTFEVSLLLEGCEGARQRSMRLLKRSFGGHSHVGIVCAVCDRVDVARIPIWRSGAEVHPRPKFRPAATLPAQPGEELELGQRTEKLTCPSMCG